MFEILERELTGEEVTNGALDNYDPSRYDFIPNGNDGGFLYRLAWWDDASYAKFQGDPVESGRYKDEVIGPDFEGFPIAFEKISVKISDSDLPF